jgi:hypothetical protein
MTLWLVMLRTTKSFGGACSCCEADIDLAGLHRLPFSAGDERLVSPCRTSS